MRPNLAVLALQGKNDQARDLRRAPSAQAS
jgi:hypothetical protein